MLLFLILNNLHKNNQRIFKFVHKKCLKIAKDEPIEIPNTSTTHSSSNGGELLLFSILGLEVILRRKKAEKRLS